MLPCVIDTSRRSMGEDPRRRVAVYGTAAAYALLLLGAVGFVLGFL
jgi:hypothetical protein